MSLMSIQGGDESTVCLQTSLCDYLHPTLGPMDNSRDSKSSVAIREHPSGEYSFPRNLSPGEIMRQSKDICILIPTLTRWQVYIILKSAI